MGFQRNDQLEAMHGTLQPLFEGHRKFLQMEEVLGKILQVLERHDETLAQHDEAISRQEEAVGKQGETLDGHVELHRSMTESRLASEYYGQRTEELARELASLVNVHGERATKFDQRFNDLEVRMAKGMAEAKLGTLEEQRAQVQAACEAEIAKLSKLAEEQRLQTAEAAKAAEQLAAKVFEEIKAGAVALGRRQAELEIQMAGLAQEKVADAIEAATAAPGATEPEVGEVDEEVAGEAEGGGLDAKSFAASKELQGKLKGVDGRLKGAEGRLKNAESKVKDLERAIKDLKEETKNNFQDSNKAETDKDIVNTLEQLGIECERSNASAKEAVDGLAALGTKTAAEQQRTRTEIDGRMQHLQAMVEQRGADQEHLASELRIGQADLTHEIQRIEMQFSSVTTGCLACGASPRLPEKGHMQKGNDGNHYKGIAGSSRREVEPGAAFLNRDWEFSATRQSLKKGGGFNTSASTFFAHSKSAQDIGRQILEGGGKR